MIWQGPNRTLNLTRPDPTRPDGQDLTTNPDNPDDNHESDTHIRYIIFARYKINANKNMAKHSQMPHVDDLEVYNKRVKNQAVSRVQNHSIRRIAPIIGGGGREGIGAGEGYWRSTAGCAGVSASGR